MIFNSVHVANSVSPLSHSLPLSLSLSFPLSFSLLLSLHLSPSPFLFLSFLPSFSLSLLFSRKNRIIEKNLA